MAYVPDCADIVHLTFDPASGHEMEGAHYALVVTPRSFNQRGLAVVCPISQGSAETSRTHGLVVTLMGCGTATQGAVHCHQIKSLDWRSRQARLREKVPAALIDEVLARIAVMFGFDG